MSSTTTGAATEARPAKDTPSKLPSAASMAERRARSLSPTVFCPSLEIEQCIERSQAGRIS